MDTGQCYINLADTAYKKDSSSIASGWAVYLYCVVFGFKCAFENYSLHILHRLITLLHMEFRKLYKMWYLIWTSGLQTAHFGRWSVWRCVFVSFCVKMGLTIVVFLMTFQQSYYLISISHHAHSCGCSSIHNEVLLTLFSALFVTNNDSRSQSFITAFNLASSNERISCCDVTSSLLAKNKRWLFGREMPSHHASSLI